MLTIIIIFAIIYLRSIHLKFCIKLNIRVDFKTRMVNFIAAKQQNSKISRNT